MRITFHEKITVRPNGFYNINKSMPLEDVTNTVFKSFLDKLPIELQATAIVESGYWSGDDFNLYVGTTVGKMDQSKWRVLWGKVGDKIDEIESSSEPVVFFHGNSEAPIKLTRLLLSNCTVSNAGTSNDTRIHLEILLKLSIVNVKYIGSIPIFFGSPVNATLSRECVIDGLSTPTKAVYADVNIAIQNGDTIKNLIPDTSNIILNGYFGVSIDLDTVLSKTRGKNRTGFLTPVNCILTSNVHWFYYRFAGTNHALTTDTAIVDGLVNGKPMSADKAYRIPSAFPVDCIVTGIDLTILQSQIQDTSITGSDSRAMSNIETNRFDSCSIEIVHARFGEFVNNVSPDHPEYWTIPDGTIFKEPAIVGESIYPINQSHMTGCDVKVRVPKSSHDDGRKTCVCLTEYINVEGDVNIPIVNRDGKKVMPLRFSSESARKPFGIEPDAKNNYLRDEPLPKPNKVNFIEPENAEYFKYYYTSVIRVPSSKSKQKYPPMVFWLVTPKAPIGMPVMDATVAKSTAVFPRAVPNMNLSGCLLLQSATFGYRVGQQNINIDEQVIAEYSDSAIDQFISWLRHGLQTVTFTNVDAVNYMTVPRRLAQMVVGGMAIEDAIDAMSIGNKRITKFTKLMLGYDEAFSKSPRNATSGNTIIASSGRDKVGANK